MEAGLAKMAPPCPKLELCPKMGALLGTKSPAAVEGCPKEKELAVLVLDAAPKTLPLLDAGGAEEAACPNAGVAPKPAWLNVKPLDGLVDWPKTGAWPKPDWPKPEAAAVPKTEGLNPVAEEDGEVAAGG